MNIGGDDTAHLDAFFEQSAVASSPKHERRLTLARWQFQPGITIVMSSKSQAGRTENRISPRPSLDVTEHLQVFAHYSPRVYNAAHRVKPTIQCPEF